MLDKYYQDFERQLNLGEKAQVSKLRRFLFSEYQKAIGEFLNTSKTSGFVGLFPADKITEVYIDTYSSIGTRLANWYVRNNEKYQIKNQNYSNVWQEEFAAIGSKIAASRVVIVQGTALKELQKELRKRMLDPDFQTIGTREKARILRKRFKTISQWQAERIIRTEATYAANRGVLAGADTLYGQGGYLKQWITTIDGRERIEHAAANGQQVPKNEKFKVGGELLAMPGDPAGSAGNVVNCRCGTAPVPFERISSMADVALGVATQALISEIEENEN
jgi:hypothetical protein